MEIEIDEREDRRIRLAQRADAAAAAWHLLGETIAEFRDEHRQRLADVVDDRFRTIIAREERRIEVAGDLRITVLERGRPILEEQLSQGTRDQLAFAVRLALLDLMAGERVFPIVLDDPFVHSDADRLSRIGEMLRRGAEERQVLLLTQDQRLLDWGDPVRIARG